MAGGRRVLFLAAALVPAAWSLDDSAALVQASAEAGLAARAKALSRSVAGRAMAASTGIAGQINQFDCDKHPKLCQPPFDCQTFTNQEFMTMQIRGFAPEGHGNLRTWCFSPDYEEYMHTCIVKKDLVAAAKLQYQWSLDKKDGVDELDGSYCFIEGHCSNAAVTNETTMEEADRMCDERYGQDWRDAGKLAWALQQPNTQLHPELASHTTGFHSNKVTATFLKLACAMGNYHCDVVYCKETYCKNPYYVKKYGHLLPKAPGHLLQSRVKV